MLLVWPLRDDGPPGSLPLVTVALMAACAAASLSLWLLPADAAAGALQCFGLVPAASTEPSHWFAPLTSLLLHASWAHLLINLAYLWLFGRGLEAALGHRRLLVLVLASGLAGELAQVLAVPASHLPMIGASGGVAGILGAYLLMFPRANILTMMVVMRTSLIVRVPALLVIIVWLATELASLTPLGLDRGGTAGFAHLGGFAAGILLAPSLRTRGLTLLQPARTAPFTSVRYHWGRSKHGVSSRT